MKGVLRKQLIEQRNQLESEEIIKRSRNIIEKLLKCNEVKKSSKIAIYFPKDNEVSTKELIPVLIKYGKRVFLPRVMDEQLEFKEILSADELEKGSFGIMEPKESSLTINVEELEMIILPCVGCDLHCNRLGRGAGYYDRLLAHHPEIMTICLAYDFQLVEKVQIEEHDQQAGKIITDKRTVEKSAKLMDGRKVSSEIIENLKQEIKEQGIKAKLAVILVGTDPASEAYVKRKGKVCEDIGIAFELIKFPQDSNEESIINKIRTLNQNSTITGILVQLPLPKHLNTDKIINAVILEKDVDGLSVASMKKLEQGDEILVCCTPKGIITLLTYYDIKLKDKHIILVGHGRLVGKPLAIMLKNRKLNVTICDEFTKDIKSKTRKADVLISATGVPHLITEDYVKEGAVVIDAGTSKKDNKLVGDVDFEQVKKKTSYITPVPGGIGPMTIAMLVENIINAFNLSDN